MALILSAVQPIYYPVFEVIVDHLVDVSQILLHSRVVLKTVIHYCFVVLVPFHPKFHIYSVAE